MRRASLLALCLLTGCTLPPPASSGYACRSDRDCVGRLGYVCVQSPDGVSRCDAAAGGSPLADGGDAHDAGDPSSHDAGAHEDAGSDVTPPDSGPPQGDDDAGVGEHDAGLPLGDAGGEVDAGPSTFPGGYGHRLVVTVRETAMADGDPIEDFPLYLALTHEALRSVTSGGFVVSTQGDDIEVRLPESNERLAHELSSYSAETGELSLWLRVPSLSTTSDSILQVYFGSDGVDAPRAQGSGVWDEDYRAVWHLDEGATHLQQVRDSTGVNHGTARNTGDGDVSEAIAGNGLGFGNSDEAVHVSSSDLDFSSSITVEAWARLEFGSGGDFPRIYQKGTEAQRAVELFVQDGFQTFGTVGFRTSYNQDSLSPSYQIPGFAYGQWHHYVGIYDEDDEEIRIYVDGVLEETETQERDVETGYSNHWIGNWNDSQLQARNWAGCIDEVRVSSVARSDAFIAASYTNQWSPGTFYDVGDVETP